MPRAERTRLRHGESSNACSIPLHYFSVRRSYLPRAGSGRYTSLSRLVVVKVQERRRVVTASSPPTSPAMRSVSLSAIRSPLCVSSTHDVNQLVHRCHYLVDHRQRGPLHLTREIDARFGRRRRPMMATGDGLASSLFVASPRTADSKELLRPSGISLARLPLPLHGVRGAPYVGS